MNQEETEQHLKLLIVDRLRQFPVMNRSMLGVTMIAYRAGALTTAVNELVKEGVVIEGTYSSHRKRTPLYYLADEANRLQPYLEQKK